MDKLRWIVFAVLTVGVLALLVIFSGDDNIDVSSVDENKLLTGSEQSGNIGDHSLGNPDSSVILVEYADFQCPGCRSADSRIKSIVTEYEEDIVFIFRNLPLSSIHPNALAASSAAEAAALQGQFWQMNSLLFENQTSWANQSSSERIDTFASYADNLGLDVDEFRNDIVSDEVAQKIRFDMALASKVGADSTPTFILNGDKLEQDVWGDDDKLREALDEAIAQ